MDDLIALVRRHQDINPLTGRFEGIRTADQYAEVLGVHPSQLSRFYAGKFYKPWPIIRGFMRVFPEAAPEVAAAMAAPAETPEPELAEVS